MTSFFSGGVDIHTQNFSFGKNLLQLIICFLCACPIITNGTALAIGAVPRNCLAIATIMAVHGLGIHVKGQRNITIGTSIHCPTLATHDKARITTTVQHQDHLLFLLQTICNCFNKNRSIVTSFILTNIIPKINHFDFWNVG